MICSTKLSLIEGSLGLFNRGKRKGRQKKSLDHPPYQSQDYFLSAPSPHWSSSYFSSSQLDDQSLYRSPVQNNQNVYRPPVHHNQNVYRPPALNNQNVYRPPVHHNQNLYRPPAHSNQDMYRPPAHNDQNVYRPPAYDNQEVYRPPVHTDQYETPGYSPPDDGYGAPLTPVVSAPCTCEDDNSVHPGYIPDDNYYLPPPSPPPPVTSSTPPTSSTTMSPCLHVFTSLQFDLESPSHSRAGECEYVIIPGDGVCSLTLTFSWFFTKQTLNCSDEFLDVMGTKLCGDLTGREGMIP